MKVWVQINQMSIKINNKYTVFFVQLEASSKIFSFQDKQKNEKFSKAGSC